VNYFYDSFRRAWKKEHCNFFTFSKLVWENVMLKTINFQKILEIKIKDLDGKLLYPEDYIMVSN
jgi:hypothetical protein